MTEARDEALNEAFRELSDDERDKVFAMAAEDGWAPGMDVPHHIWWEYIHRLPPLPGPL